MRLINHIFLFTITILLLASCTGNSGIEEKKSSKDTAVVADTLQLKDSIMDNGIKVVFTPITAEEYREDSIAHWKEIPGENAEMFIKEDSLLVSHHDSTYSLLLNNGRTIKLKSHENTEGDDYIQYSYMGMTKGRDFFIFSVGLYEYMEYELVNASTGKTSSLWNYPMVSPNGKWMLTFSYDMEAGFLPNGFQVMRTVKDTIVGVSYEGLRWGVPNGFWVSGNAADIVQTVPVFGGNEYRYDYHYARVEVKEENGK